MQIIGIVNMHDIYHALIKKLKKTKAWWNIVVNRVYFLSEIWNFINKHHKNSYSDNYVEKEWSIYARLYSFAYVSISILMQRKNTLSAEPDYLFSLVVSVLWHPNILVKIYVTSINSNSSPLRWYATTSSNVARSEKWYF